MHRLIYASAFSARFPRERQDQAYDINAIVRVSLRNNRAAGLTSLLLIHRGHFLQALEGPGLAIANTYDRIVRDRRHEGAQVISLEEVSARAFGDWGLCACRLDADDEALRSLERDAHGDLSALDPAAALSLLTAVRDTQTRTLLAAMA
jgi:hypothetical protein